jgi:uncharacterized protein (TIGR03437 family)
MAMAPSTFGDYAGALLVGNFGDGWINAFDPVSGRYLGPLKDGKGSPIAISGLWGLTFGNGFQATPGAAPAGGDANTLYFTAGIAGPDTVESHGLFGTLAPAPQILTSGVVNAASFSSAIAPGGFAAIFGSGLAATTRAWTTTDFSNGSLPTQLDGVSVTIDGKAAYVYFVSPGQIDVIAPPDSASGAVPVIVSNNGVAGTAANAQLQGVSPAFFAAGKYVLATHQDGTLIGPANFLPGATPAAPNETIMLYGTGFGATATAVDGLVLSAPVNLATPPAVTIGTTTGTVSFSGLINAGLDQINVKVPAGLVSTGVADVPISAVAGSAATQTGLFLTVKSAQ